jgi:hypothetical protein
MLKNRPDEGAPKPLGQLLSGDGLWLGLKALADKVPIGVL